MRCDAKEGRQRRSRENLESFLAHGDIPLQRGRDVQRKVVWCMVLHFGFPSDDTSSALLVLRTQKRAHFEGCAEDPLNTITATLPGFIWSVLLLHTVMEDPVGEISPSKRVALRLS